MHQQRMFQPRYQAPRAAPPLYPTPLLEPALLDLCEGRRRLHPIHSLGYCSTATHSCESSAFAMASPLRRPSDMAHSVWLRCHDLPRPAPVRASRRRTFSARRLYCTSLGVCAWHKTCARGCCARTSAGRGRKSCKQSSVRHVGNSSRSAHAQ